MHSVAQFTALDGSIFRSSGSIWIPYSQSFTSLKSLHQHQILYNPLRRKTVAKEAVYIAIGIDEDGHKEVLDFTIAPTESAMVWEELIQGLKARGLENVFLFISAGLFGMTDATCRVYPYAKHQTCLVHIARNINGKARVSDREEIAGDFKKIHQATDLESAKRGSRSFWKEMAPII